MFSKWLADEDATVACGELFGRTVSELGGGAVVYLDGQLGAGKTTFCRGVLQAFGHSGAVKSPTYTLVEPYELPEQCVYHFDLYRLGDPQELEFMGIREYFDGRSICLIEWPQRGEGCLAKADILLELSADKGGRNLLLRAQTAHGAQILSLLQ